MNAFEKPARPTEPVGPRVRRPVAVIVSRFPLITETFILREMNELERQGQPVRLVPLLREKRGVVHQEVEPWISRAMYTPFLSPSILLANLRVLARHPRRYVVLLARVLAGSARSLNLLLGTLGIFPKSVYLSERLASEGVGHVHAHFATHPAMAAYIVSCLSGIEFSVTVHAHDIFVRRAILGEKLRAASFIRAISRFNERYLAERYPSESTGKIHVVHVGVDPATYRRQPERESARGGTPARLLCVAAFKPYKGLPVLVEACRRLKEKGFPFRCDLVGDGPLRGDIDRLLQARGLTEEIHLLGSRPQHEVASFLARAEIFVLPSVVAPDGQMEGIPVALMEAMASGLPVVASSLSGVAELVEDGVSGRLVPPGDPEALAAAVARLADDPARARRMGERGRRKIHSEFRLQGCVARLIDLLDRFSPPAPDDVERTVRQSSDEALRKGWIGVRAVRDTADSRVLELLVPNGNGSRELVYKIHKSRNGESRPPAERALGEFRILAELQSRLLPSDGGHAVPRPVFLDASAEALAVEACRGARLDTLLRRARVSRSPQLLAEAESALRRSGAWLRAFQAGTVLRRNGVDWLECLTDRAHEELARRGAEPFLGPHAPVIRERLLTFGRTVAARPPSVCGQHGDFWPGNIFVDRDTVTAIDFEGYREGLPFEDVAYFTLQLDLFFSYPLLGRRRRRFSRAFLEGYEQGGSLDGDQFLFCRITKALGMLSEPTHGGNESLRSRWRRNLLLAACLHG